MPWRCLEDALNTPDLPFSWLEVSSFAVGASRDGCFLLMRVYPTKECLLTAPALHQHPSILGCAHEDLEGREPLAFFASNGLTPEYCGKRPPEQPELWEGKPLKPYHFNRTLSAQKASSKYCQTSTAKQRELWEQNGLCPGAKGPPEFVPESPLQKKGLWESYFLQGIRGKTHTQNLQIRGKTLWGPLARPAPFVYFRFILRSAENCGRVRWVF